MMHQINDTLPTQQERTLLNGQRREALKRQRAAVCDFQDMLYSTDVALIFLDKGLSVRFFTPAAGCLFNLIAGDVGRPLADRVATTVDGALLGDMTTVLRTRAPLDRRVETSDGRWYQRRVLPCRAPDGGVEGVILSFTDISRRRHLAVATDETQSPVGGASVAELRFLASASHDLKQPLQAITLLQSRLARTVEGKDAKALVGRLQSAVEAMSTMVGALLDVYRIEAGVVQVSVTDFSVTDLYDRLKAEFVDPDQFNRVRFHGFDLDFHVRSDPHLLEQICRNMLTDALRVSDQDEVMFVCQPRGEHLSLEVWDSLTTAPHETPATMADRQPCADRALDGRGEDVGLGLSIVYRLADLLGHPVRGRAVAEGGSVCSITIPVVEVAPALAETSPAEPAPDTHSASDLAVDADRSVVYVVDDESQIRGLMRDLLEDEGLSVLDFATSEEFLGAYRPRQHSCLLIDARMPGMGGRELLQKLRSMDDDIPAIMITGSGDLTMAVAAMKAGARDFLEKPVAVDELLGAVHSALEQSRHTAKRAASRTDAVTRVADLTERQREIMDLVLAGHPSKNIAADLGISQRTVESHRAAIMQKTGARSLPALARLALAARVSEGA